MSGSDTFGFDFETAQKLIRQMKRARRGEFDPSPDNSVPVENSNRLLWAYVPTTITTTWDDTIKAWSVGGAVTCYPLATGRNATAQIQFGITDNDGVVTGGIACTTFTPKISPAQSAPEIAAGFHLGVIFGEDAITENPRVLIALPQAGGSGSGSGGGGEVVPGENVIEVVTDVNCTPNGLTVSTVSLSAAGYDNAVIRQFLALSDVTPKSFLGNQNRVVMVNPEATSLIFGPELEPEGVSFLGLTDTPDTFSGQANKVVLVNPGATGLTYSAHLIITGGSVVGGGNPADNFVTIQLFGDAETPGDSMVYGTNAAGTRGWQANKFTTLADCPVSLVGHGGKLVRVKADETGLEFFTL